MKDPMNLTGAEMNDTLDGKLFDYEIEGEKHLRDKLGYWRIVEKRMILNRLIAESIVPEGTKPNDRAAIFLISSEVTKNHAADLSYRQIQDLGRYRRPPSVAKIDVAFTEEELMFLVEQFSGARQQPRSSGNL
jgi:hypothetical protein